jgi:hypothetical protein
MVDIAARTFSTTRPVGVTFPVVLVPSQFGTYLGFIENASIIIDNTVAWQRVT